MKLYDKYKDSGIAWLGQIPEHWEVCRLSQLSQEYFKSNKDLKSRNLLSLSYGRIVSKDIDNTEGLLPASFSTYQVIRNGNIVLRLTDLQNDQRSLRVGLCTQEGIITSAYLTIEPRCNVQPKFLYLSLHTADIKKVFYSMGSGLRQNLNWKELRKLEFPLPPLSEQEAIVSYLDRKVSEMDCFMSKQEVQISYLKELKQATIAKAVTRGIDPSVALKDSGIPWLGQIPEHWEVRKIKYILSERSDKGYPNEPVLCSTQKYGVIPQSLYENRVVEVNKGHDGLKLVKEGNFVISLRSFQGGIEYAHYRGIISAAYTVLELDQEHNPEYMKYLLKSFSFIQLLQACVMGIREGQNINYSLLRKNFLPLPPLSEQEAIVSYLDEKLGNIDRLIAASEEAIARVRELKQTLIADVVTGRICVQLS